jgi:hypothetical protein
VETRVLQGGQQSQIPLLALLSGVCNHVGFDFRVPPITVWIWFECHPQRFTRQELGPLCGSAGMWDLEELEPAGRFLGQLGTYSLEISGMGPQAFRFLVGNVTSSPQHTPAITTRSSPELSQC